MTFSGKVQLLCQSPEKFITDYEAYRRRRADCHLTEEVIERHEELFGETPDVLAADMGFCPDQEKYEELQGRVGTLAIPRRMRDLADAVMRMWRSFRGDRGDDLRLKTGVSAGPLPLSRL